VGARRPKGQTWRWRGKLALKGHAGDAGEVTELPARSHAELSERLFQVVLDGLFGDAQGARDIAVAGPTSNAHRHLPLPAGETLKLAAGGTSVAQALGGGSEGHPIGADLAQRQLGLISQHPRLLQLASELGRDEEDLHWDHRRPARRGSLRHRRRACQASPPVNKVRMSPVSTLYHRYNVTFASPTALWLCADPRWRWGKSRELLDCSILNTPSAAAAAPTSAWARLPAAFTGPVSDRSPSPLAGAPDLCPR
jgi:hypothetical protein